MNQDQAGAGARRRPLSVFTFKVTQVGIALVSISALVINEYWSLGFSARYSGTEAAVFINESWIPIYFMFMVLWTCFLVIRFEGMARYYPGLMDILVLGQGGLLLFLFASSNEPADGPVPYFSGLGVLVGAAGWLFWLTRRAKLHVSREKPGEVPESLFLIARTVSRFLLFLTSLLFLIFSAAQVGDVFYYLQWSSNRPATMFFSLPVSVALFLCFSFFFVRFFFMATRFPRMTRTFPLVAWLVLILATAILEILYPGETMAKGYLALFSGPFMFLPLSIFLKRVSEGIEGAKLKVGEW